MKIHRGNPIVPITHPDIEAYSEAHTSPESEGVRALIESSDRELKYIDMLSGKLVGQLLKILVQVSGAQRILEIGTFTGYSAVTMAEALPDDGELITLEMKGRYINLARKHFLESTVAHKITLVEGNAQETIDELEGEFDFIYLDGDKLRYSFYYEKSIKKLKSNGLLVVDNVLWDATVLNPHDNKSQAINDFNKLVSEDTRVEQVLLPIRDGVNVIRKI